MYLPITNTIFSGALSPSALDGQCSIDERLKQDVRRLENLPATLQQISALLAAVLAGWNAEMPPLPLFLCWQADFLFRYELYTPLLGLRADELDYALRLSGYMEISTSRYSFYAALLKAESRWLKLSLWEKIQSLHSDDDSRILLVEVLDEIYDTYTLLKDHGARSVQVGVSRQLHISLAMLYLDLTITFGSLLHATDYRAYYDVVNDTYSHQPMSEVAELEYAILQGENQVRKLVGGAGVSAEKVYGELVDLHACLSGGTVSKDRLCRGVLALENYLFFYLSGISLEPDERFLLLTDKRWIDHRLTDISLEYYSGDQSYSEARGARNWIAGQLREPCFTFLSPLIELEESLPRQLRSFLQKKKSLYEKNFSGTFVPFDKQQISLVVPLQNLVSKEVDEGQVHKMLAFLSENKGAREGTLMQQAQIQQLHGNYCHFLRTGAIPPLGGRKKITVPKGRAGIIYGLFFDDCDVRQADAAEYAKFLAEVLDTDATAESLRSNVQRYVQAFRRFRDGRVG